MSRDVGPGVDVSQGPADTRNWLRRCVLLGGRAGARNPPLAWCEAVLRSGVRHTLGSGVGCRSKERFVIRDAPGVSCERDSMPVVNALARELVFKIVYYGPGLGGKTSSLQFIHRASKPEHRGRMVSLATPVDRTLYFDFLPIRLPTIRNLSVRLQLFTVPGQVYYNATRRLVLTGADGVVFVADSQQARAEANLESIENLRENLQQHGRPLQDVPHVLQYNKRDLPELVSVEDLEEALNWYGVPSFATIATSGEGIFESLEAVTRAVLEDFERRAPEQVPPSSRFEAPEGGLAEALRAAEPSTATVAHELHHPTREADQPNAELPMQRGAESARPEPDGGDAPAAGTDALGMAPAGAEELASGGPGSGRDEGRPRSAEARESFELAPSAVEGGADSAVPSREQGPSREEVGPPPSDGGGGAVREPGGSVESPAAVPTTGIAESVQESSSTEQVPDSQVEPRSASSEEPPAGTQPGIGLLAVSVADAVASGGKGGPLPRTAPSPPSELSVAVPPVPPLTPVAVVAVGGMAGALSAEPQQSPAAGLSLSDFWGEGERDAVLALERALALHEHGLAVEAAHAVVRRELDRVGARLRDLGEAQVNPLGACQFLAVDVRRYLRLRAEVEACLAGHREPTRRDALSAYVLALEVRRASAELESQINGLEPE